MPGVVEAAAGYDDGDQVPWQVRDPVPEAVLRLQPFVRAPKAVRAGHGASEPVPVELADRKAAGHFFKGFALLREVLKASP